MGEFFEPPSRSGLDFETLPAQEWDGPPRDAVPAVVPIEQVVARNEKVGIFLAAIWVYRAGFEFDVFVVAKDPSSELDPFNYEHQLRAEQTGEIPPEQLRLGFHFADGTTAANTGDRFDWEGEIGSVPKTPVMRGTRGTAGGGDWSQAFWVWPTPPAGPLEFVCEWPEAGIPLTRSELDSAAIRDASSRSLRIFLDS